MTHPRQAGCFAQTVSWAAEGTSYKEDVIGKLPYPAQSPFRWACRTEYRVTGLLLLKARVAFGRRRRNHFRILRRRSFWGAVIALKPVISGLPECRLGRGPTPPPILILMVSPGTMVCHFVSSRDNGMVAVPNTISEGCLRVLPSRFHAWRNLFFHRRHRRTASAAGGACDGYIVARSFSHCDDASSVSNRRDRGAARSSSYDLDIARG